MPEEVAIEQQTQAPPLAAPPAESQPAQNPADQAPATTTEGEQPAAQESTDEQPEKKGQSRFQRRLNTVYRKYGEEKARADFLQKQLDESKSQATPQASQADSTSPRIEQFDNIETWRAAVEKHASEKAIKEYESKQRVAAQQTASQRLTVEWEEKVSSAEDKYEDFADVVGEMKAVNPLTSAIMSADNGPDVAYYLGKHLKEAEEIGKLDPVRQLVAIGRLAEKLSAKPPEAKQPSSAPKPIVPIVGKAASASEAISPDDDFETFLRKRNKQLGRTRK